MRIINWIKYALDNIIKYPRKFVILIFSMLISSVLLGIALFMVFNTNKDERMADDILMAGLGNTVRFNFDSADGDCSYENYIACIDEINSSEIIDSIGMILWEWKLLDECFDELIERQADYGIDTENGLDIVVVNKDIFNFCNINLYKGELPEKLGDNEEYTYIYLGYYYADIPVGTVYEGTDGIRFKVAGILESDSGIMNPTYAERAMWPDSSVIDLDARILVIDDEMCYGSVIFASSPCDYSDVKSEIIRIADTYGFEAQVDSLQKIADDKREYDAGMISAMLRLVIIILIVVVIVQTCIQMAVAMDNVYKYGIMMVNGFKLIDIWMINIAEAVIRILVALTGTYACSVIYINYEYSIIISRKLARELFITQVMPVIGCVLMIISIIALLIPMIYLTKKSRAELIGGKRI